MPLAEVHRAAGAILTEIDGAAVPRRFTDPSEELRAARQAVAIADRSHLGRLVLTGGRRAAYLQRVTAGATAGLRPPAGARTAVLERTGKIVDLLTIHAFSGHLLALCSAGRRVVARDWLRKFIFREDVQVADRTRETGQLQLLGPRAPELAAALAGPEAAGLAPLSWRELPDGEGILIAGDWPGEDTFLLLGEAGRMEGLWRRALEAGASLGARAAGEEAFQAARVLVGAPEGGREIDERSNPLELGRADSVDLSKGCFTGQEALAKMVTHDAVRRRLVGLELEGGPLPEPGSPLRMGGEEVGRLTSAVELPGTVRRVALGLLRRERAEPGTRLEVGSEEAGVPARVESLPFSS